MTGARLRRHCRKAGILLAADGDCITFDAPAGIAVPVDELRRLKPELLALLEGDYLGAALALLLRLPADQQAEMLYLFDERAGICEFDGGMSRGEAERQAYIELARAVEGGP